MRLPRPDTTSLVLALTLGASLFAHLGVHYRLGELAKQQALALALLAQERGAQEPSVMEFDLSAAPTEAPPSAPTPPRPEPQEQEVDQDADQDAEQDADDLQAARARRRAAWRAEARERERQRERARERPEPEPVAELQLPEPPPPAVAPPTPPPPPPPPPAEEVRVAVRQRSQNPEEPPPDTQYIADENNRVDEETVADVTNLDRDDTETSVGAEMEAAADLEEPGNATEAQLAESEDVEGSDARRPAPEEIRRRETPRATDQARAEGRVRDTPAPPDSRAERQESGDGRAGGARQRVDGARGRSGGGTLTSNGAPSVIASSSGSWTLGPEGIRGTGPGDQGGESRRSRRAEQGREGGAGAGTRGRSRGPGAGSGRPGPNLTLRYSQLVDIVGEERLAEEREAHYAERRSRLRGSSSGQRWQQFRAALENYTPSVRPGTQTALNAARSPFATYIARMHDRVHQTYHQFVENLPYESSSPFGDQSLRTMLEIVLNRDGSVLRVGIVRSSGLSMFDYGAYNAVMRGQPYPVAPEAILSGDGRVYMHWDFHRQQPYCHQSHARPYILPNLTPSAEDIPPGGLQQDTVVPDGARATFGVGASGGERGAEGDSESDAQGQQGEEGDEGDEGERREPRDPEGDAPPARPAPRPPLSRGPRL